jgi:hypothetical protein
MKSQYLGLLAAGIFAAPLTLAAPVTSPSDLNAARTIIDFESYAIGTLGPINAAGATISGSPSGSVAVASSLSYTQYPGVVSGNIFGFSSNVSFFVDFAQPVAQFGMGVFDPNYPGYGSPSTSVTTLRLYDAGNVLLGTTVSGTADFPVGPPGGSWSTFVGFTFATNQIARVELIGAPGDLMGIDNVSFYRVTGVAEPGTLALLGLGLAGLGLSRRRKA